METGVISEDDYLTAVTSLAAQHGVDRYFAHRKEARGKLARIADLGLRIEMPELPLEVAIREGAVGRLVISFPSTVVHTLPVVLADTAAELLVCDIDPTGSPPTPGPTPPASWAPSPGRPDSSTDWPAPPAQPGPSPARR